jgi:hypothetical protein
MELLTPTELAKALKHPRQYITMMRRAGYRYEYEAAARTTLEHALSALKRAPEFRAGHYEKPGWERLPKLLADAKPKLTAGAKGE